MLKNKKSFVINSFFAAVFVLGFLTQNSLASNSRNLTIFAEPNMVLALTKIARIYSQKANVVVSLNLESSHDLIDEIDSGEPADVFISAHPEMNEALRQKGLVDVYNISYVARDELVLVTSKQNSKILPQFDEKNKLSLEEALAILDQSKVNLIIDNESNASGIHSRELIRRFHFLQFTLFNKLSEDKSTIISVVKNNPDSYALLLSSQVRSDSGLRVLASSKGESIFYQALVIAGDNMEIAREFLKFLTSHQAKKIFKESNFVID